MTDLRSKLNHRTPEVTPEVTPDVDETTKCKREWIGLTEAEIEEIAKWADKHAAPWHLEFARAVEAKLKEKNSESS